MPFTVLDNSSDRKVKMAKNKTKKEKFIWSNWHEIVTLNQATKTTDRKNLQKQTEKSWWYKDSASVFWMFFHLLPSTVNNQQSARINQFLQFIKESVSEIKYKDTLNEEKLFETP